MNNCVRTWKTRDNKLFIRRRIPPKSWIRRKGVEPLLSQNKHLGTDGSYLYPPLAHMRLIVLNSSQSILFEQDDMCQRSRGNPSLVYNVKDSTSIKANRSRSFGRFHFVAVNQPHHLASKRTTKLLRDLLYHLIRKPNSKLTFWVWFVIQSLNWQLFHLRWKSSLSRSMSMTHLNWKWLKPTFVPLEKSALVLQSSLLIGSHHLCSRVGGRCAEIFAC